MTSFMTTTRTWLGGWIGPSHSRMRSHSLLSGDLKWGALSAADAFALPSHQENFGIAVAEALACGTPVLISNKINIWREIEADGAGIVADDTEEGAKALLESWRDMPQEAKEGMRDKSRACFLKNFEITAGAASLIAALGLRDGQLTS